MAQQMLKGNVSRKIMIDKKMSMYSQMPYLACLPSVTFWLVNFEEKFLVDETLIIFVCDEESIFHLEIGFMGLKFTFLFISIF